MYVLSEDEGLVLRAVEAFTDTEVRRRRGLHPDDRPAPAAVLRTHVPNRKFAELPVWTA